jgi:CheY-like chemotaxis protein
MPISLHATIVIADGNASTRQLARSILAGYGVRRVIECRDGFEVIEAVERQRPDALLIDEAMPGLDGVEVTRLLRKSQRGVELTPVILVAAAPRREHVLAAISARVHEIVAKPFSARALHNRVSACLDRPRPFVRSKSYFGPVPYSKEIYARIVAGADPNEVPVGTCVTRGGLIDVVHCTLGEGCHCRAYAGKDSQRPILGTAEEFASL